jgi:hypothetical protein
MGGRLKTNPPSLFLLFRSDSFIFLQFLFFFDLDQTAHPLHFSAISKNPFVQSYSSGNPFNFGFHCVCSSMQFWIDAACLKPFPSIGNQAPVGALTLVQS